MQDLHLDSRRGVTLSGLWIFSDDAGPISVVRRQSVDVRHEWNIGITFVLVFRRHPFSLSRWSCFRKERVVCLNALNYDHGLLTDWTDWTAVRLDRRSGHASNIGIVSALDLDQSRGLLLSFL